MAQFVPYCGIPPSPLTVHWNHAPVLTTIVILIPLLYLYLVGRQSVIREVLQISGWTILALCFLSPLCNMGVALFSARATQHVILVLIAAPLLAFRKKSVRGGTLPLVVSATAFTAIVWLWHSPRLYDATLQNNLVYWTMNVTMIGSAVWFWRCVFRAEILPNVAAVSCIGLQMCALGALIAFAKSPFYSVHADTTWLWGLSQLDDQRLGGLIMWVPAGLLGVGYSAAVFWLGLARMDRRSLSVPAHMSSSPATEGN
jgi:putative membrane protein